MSPRGREGRPRQRAQLCCCHGKGGGPAPNLGRLCPHPTSRPQHKRSLTNLLRL